MCRKPSDDLSSPVGGPYPDRMRLLLTNDDGIDADGLDALLNAVRGLGEAVERFMLRAFGRRPEPEEPAAHRPSRSRAVG